MTAIDPGTALAILAAIVIVTPCLLWHVIVDQIHRDKQKG